MGWETLWLEGDYELSSEAWRGSVIHPGSLNSKWQVQIKDRAVLNFVRKLTKYRALFIKPAGFWNRPDLTCLKASGLSCWHLSRKIKQWECLRESSALALYWLSAGFQVCFNIEFSYSWTLIPNCKLIACPHSMGQQQKWDHNGLVGFFPK